MVRGDGVILTAGTQLVPTGSPVLVARRAGNSPCSGSGNHRLDCGPGGVHFAVHGTVSVFKSGKLVTDIQKATNGSRLAI